jgi:hypothetical protein
MPIVLQLNFKAGRLNLIRALELLGRVYTEREKNSDYLLNCSDMFLETLLILLGAGYSSIETTTASEYDKYPPCMWSNSELIDFEV